MDYQKKNRESYYLNTTAGERGTPLLACYC